MVAPGDWECVTHVPKTPDVGVRRGENKVPGFRSPGLEMSKSFHFLCFDP